MPNAEEIVGHVVVRGLLLHFVGQVAVAHHLRHLLARPLGHEEAVTTGLGQQNLHVVLQEQPQHRWQPLGRCARWRVAASVEFQENGVVQGEQVLHLLVRQALLLRRSEEGARLADQGDAVFALQEGEHHAETVRIAARKTRLAKNVERAQLAQLLGNDGHLWKEWQVLRNT